MNCLPCLANAVIPVLASRRIFSYPYKLRTQAVLCFALAMTTCEAWNCAQAQQPLQTLHSHVRSAVSNRQAGLVGTLPTEQSMNATIILPLRNQAELTSLLGRLYDPTSPDYRHFLSVDQFTEQFGPTAEDYQAVIDFAHANGLTVTDNPRNHLIVPISGTVAQINQALHVTMRVYQHPSENRTFFSADREPSLNLSVPVAHIAGLNNFSIPRPMLEQAQEGQVIADVTGSGPGGSYLGSDMRAAYYGGTTLNGNRQAVGILEFDGYNLSDVNATFSMASQSYSVPINNVLLDGANAGSDGNDGEQVLDIVQAIGMAPGLSQVRVYIGVATSNALDDANIFNSMATENIAKQISVSWGWEPDDPTTDDVFFQEFAAQGQTVFVASGDNGAFDAAISPYFYPSEDPYVTSVGGTHLTTNGAGGTWASEAAWNSSNGSHEYGSGGGISPDGFAIPSWQAGLANSSNGGSNTVRNEPDVAMEGDFDNYSCSQGSCNGGWAGTSFAAPRWAGFMALVNQQAVEAGNAPQGGLGFINPAIYSVGNGTSYNNDFHDVTSGNNDTDNQPVWFSAVTGYDLVTGWGSPTGQDLIDALAGPQVPGFWLLSSSSTVFVNQGASNSTTITVTDAGGFTGNVTLAVTSTLPTGVTASWGTNPTSGSSILTLTAIGTAPAETANVIITGTSASMTVTTTIAVTVHGPSFVLSASPSSLGINTGQLRHIDNHDDPSIWFYRERESGCNWVTEWRDRNVGHESHNWNQRAHTDGQQNRNAWKRDRDHYWNVRQSDREHHPRTEYLWAELHTFQYRYFEYGPRQQRYSLCIHQ
jgi:subtilase family serine protease